MKNALVILMLAITLASCWMAYDARTKLIAEKNRLYPINLMLDKKSGDILIVVDEDKYAAFRGVCRPSLRT